MKEQYEEAREKRERELRSQFAEQMKAALERGRREAARSAEKKTGQEPAALKEQLNDQSRELDEAREVELAIRKRERELERRREDLEATVERRWRRLAA